MSTDRRGEVMGGGALRIVLVTHPRDGSEEFARGIVEARLAACANLLPARSVFRWEGAVQSEPETLIVLKTRAAKLAALLGHLESRHPYEVPEFVVVPVQGVSRPYRDWLLAATDSGEVER